MKKLLKDKELLHILLGGILLIAGLLTEHAFKAPELAQLIVYGVALLFIGYETFWEAIRGIFHGRMLDETFLMSIASVGAFFIGEYAEGVAVMLFYLVGEYFEHRAVRRSRATIRSLMDINPDTALVVRDSQEQEIDATEVQIGETVVLRPGTRVPVDCTVVSGSAAVDTAALTGESAPLDAAPGTKLSSGMIIIDGVMYATADKTSETSAAARILNLVQEASDRKSKQENFIAAFARVYTPIVVGLAVLVAFAPPLIHWAVAEWSTAVLKDWVYRALMFLVVSCPCALVLSVPLAFFGGIGNAASRGILFKGGCSFDALSNAKIAVFDKTGTLTQGKFTVTEVHPAGVSREELLRYMSAAESHSTHPIALAIRAASPDTPAPQSVKEVAGKGLFAEVDGARIAVGNIAWMNEIGATVPVGEEGIYAARDGVYIGCVQISDTLRPETVPTIAALRKCGIRRTVMLTGDAEKPAKQMADAAGLDEYHAALLPADKYKHLEALINEGQGVMYVGDGINDAPSLARADVGIAMGGVGSDAAIEAADVVIMNDNLARLPEAFAVARKTLSIARINIIFALTVKIAVMVCAAAGWLSKIEGGMWIAVFADVGVALLAVLNSLRTIFQKKKSKH
jgi:Cd2+/Zn2+-exporting ATPase